MSVLLEALKKAAEDKKKALEKSGQSNKVEVFLVQEDTAEKNTIPESSVESESSDLKVQAVLDKPSEIKLSLNESVASTPIESIKKAEIIKTTPTRSSKKTPEVAFKLDLNLDNTQETEKTSNELKVSGEEVSNGLPKASLKLAIEAKTEQNNSLLDKILTEKVAMLSTIPDQVESSSSLEEPMLRTVDSLTEASIESEPAQASEKLKNNESVDLHLEKEVSITPVLSKNTVDSLKDEALGDVYQGSADNEYVAQSDLTALKTEFDQSESREGTVSKHEGSSTHLSQHSVKKPNLKVDKNALKEDEDSYEWSLDALPGYLGLGRNKNKNKKIKKMSADGENPILVAAALSEDPARSTKKSSVKLILILLVLLLLIGIVVYGFLYYQEQHDALEQRMQKYNLVKTHITVEEGASTTNKSSENRVEKPDANPEEQSLSQTPLSSVVHDAASIEDIQKTYIGSSDSFEKNNQTRTEAQSQNDIKKPITSGTVTLPLERERNKEVTSAPKTLVQSSDKKITETVSNTPRKAVIVVHSEEQILSEAYLSYGQGDFTRAQQSFETVLTMNSNNEFALIGLGNILVSDQQYGAAMDFYQKALVAQPSSLNVFEAIANISGHIELNVDWKNALSEMAQDHSESATLQYALGNVYAEENDWLSAQAAYFQAVALEPDNADYLVNLAVSLDQLGKYQLAARYYTEALAFVDVEAVNFNETQVKNRLISIRQFMVGRTQ